MAFLGYLKFIIFVSGALFVGSHAVLTGNKPAVIMVPGAFHRAAVYDGVKLQLSNAGYTDLNAVDLPSASPLATKIDRTPDIIAVQNLIARYVARGRDVVLVGNSYGCTVIGDALKEFEDRSSLKVTAKGQAKILGIIMLSGFIPYINEPTISHPDIRIVSPSWFRFTPSPPASTPLLVSHDGNLSTFPPQQTFYNLLPPATADYWSSQLLPSSFAALNATARYIPYDGKFRTLYVIGEKDNSVSPELARSYISQEGAKFEVLTIDGDHIPMLSRTEKVVSIVRCFVGEKIYGC